MKELIKIRDLTMSYGEKAVLSDVSITIPENVRCAIIGPNGAGKSTLIKGALDLVEPIKGDIKFWGKKFNSVRKKISYVPQIGEVNWDFPTTVYDVVLMGRYQKLGLFKRPKKEDKKKASESLKAMGIYDLKDRQISQLSGGQKQRVFIARALCQDSDLYIMDEPLAGVDEATEKIIMDIFLELQSMGKTVIAVHHDLHTIEKYFDHVIMLNKTVMANGPVKEVFNRENLGKIFTGEVPYV